MAQRRLRLGMVGGGRGAFIGAVHRIASRIDDRWELVAGALSSDAERARLSGEDLGIAPDRVYGDFREMARAEAAREDGIDAVSIVTPNHMHAEPAIAFLQAGIHVICDKPLAATPDQAQAIAEAGRPRSARFILTHNYTGYPLIRQAREMIANGDLGEIRLVQAEYAQDWLTETVEAAGTTSRPPGAPTPPRRRGARWATSAPTPSTSCLRHRPAARGAARRPAKLRRGPPRGRQRPCPAALGTGARGCSGPPRSRPATRTACACASTAPRPASTGSRRTPTA
jgi:hypothetical protein